MERIKRAAYAEINLDNIEYNIQSIKNHTKNHDIIAVVKADAYGHGDTEVAKILEENNINRFAVAVLSEAINLRNSGITSNIMLLGFTPLSLASDIINNNIEQTVYDLDYAKSLSKAAETLNKNVKIHIAIDTGMGRIGFMPNKNGILEIAEIYSLKNIDIIGIFSHFSSSDEENKDYTNMQYEKFQYVISELENMDISIPIKHISNSAAIIDMPETYLDAVRAGIILYGYYPSNDVKLKNISIKPALTIKSKISHIKELDTDMYVSYNRTYKTTRKTIIATIPVGYADGYSRALSNKGSVIVNGKLAPVIGNVCMDQFMIDITECGNVTLDDEVILLGNTKDITFNADDIAHIINSINYEVLCMIKNRLAKVYIRNKKIIKVENY